MLWYRKFRFVQNMLYWRNSFEIMRRQQLRPTVQPETSPFRWAISTARHRLHQHTRLLPLLVCLPGTVFRTLSATWVPPKLLSDACWRRFCSHGISAPIAVYKSTQRHRHLTTEVSTLLWANSCYDRFHIVLCFLGRAPCLFSEAGLFCSGQSD